MNNQMDPGYCRWSGLHSRRFTAAEVRDTSNGGKETLALLGEGHKPATDCRVSAVFLSSGATAAEAPKLTFRCKTLKGVLKAQQTSLFGINNKTLSWVITSIKTEWMTVFGGTAAARNLALSTTRR
jgi:hypothetical protein